MMLITVLYLRLTAFHNKTNPQHSYMGTPLHIAKQDIPERQQPKVPNFHLPEDPNEIYA